MSTIHFLNVLEGDCNIIQHDSGRVSVIDVSCADNHSDTPAEKAVKESKARKEMKERNYVPGEKKNYGQKHIYDNPIDYLEKFGIKNIFRFIVTHPDMDHLDGLKDFFDTLNVTNVWATDNKKELNDFSGGGYNVEDWEFYKSIRDNANKGISRHTFVSKDEAKYFDEDLIHILAPTDSLIKDAIAKDDYNDSSYVLLYTPPKAGGKSWKILFAGDSHDKTWDYILNDDELGELVSNVDVLFAPHHGRDSSRKYDFLDIVKPRVTLFGNASFEHLAYDSYKKFRITNNQAGYIIIDISEEMIVFYAKNEEFADDFNKKRGWGKPLKVAKFDAYGLIRFDA
jgi:competence protein ComEC